MCVCLYIHVHGAGPTSSMGVNFISQETSTILYCGDEFPGDIEFSVAGIAVLLLVEVPWWAFLCQDPRALAPLWGIMYSDKAACLLLGQAQARWVCTVPVAAGHQQG